MDSLQFTFEKLKQVMAAKIAAGIDVTPSSGPNLMSAFSSFMAERGFTDSEIIGSHLRASYHKTVGSHTVALKKQNRPPEYINNRKSLLAKWRRVLLDEDKRSAATSGRSAPFQAALKELFSAGISIRGTSLVTAMPLATLKRWLNGSVPNGRSIRWVPVLENHLALPRGTLSDLLPHCEKHEPGALAQATDENSAIAYRQRLRVASAEPYALKVPSPALRKEWQDFVAYKTRAGKRGQTGILRSKAGKWSTTTAPVKPMTEANWFAFHNNQYVATASFTWNLVSQYLGWLMLDESRGGKAMSAESAMTLEKFARVDLIGDYIDWRIAKSNGIVHNGIFAIQKFVAALCNPVTGYLTQSFDKFSVHSECATQAEWQATCNVAYEDARSLLEDSSDVGLGKSRDSFEALQATLELPNPLDAVADAVSRMDANRPYTGGKTEAVWARDRLLLKLLASNPLRDKNLRLMTYKEDGSGHLRKVDGVWRIVIARHEFKNAKGAAKHRDYNMSIRPEVWPDIERYLRHYRPLLVETGNACLFLSSKKSNSPWQSLQRRFATITRKYLRGCLGVGPHGMRHIVATSILKTNPNDWATAAWALHDMQETVMKSYAHLRSDDAARWLDPVMRGPFSRM